MSSLRSILVALALAAIGGSWLLYEEEIRAFTGWQKAEEPIEDEPKKSDPSANPRPRSTPSDDPSSDPPPPGEEEKIIAIVTQRYPEPTAKPFEETFPNITSVPAAAFPDRVRTDIDVSFIDRKGNGILGASLVKSGGWVKPVEFSGNEMLVVGSLAFPGITTEIPVQKTDLEEKVREAYELSLERARKRVVEMRALDASEIEANHRLRRRLEESGKIWDEERTPEIEGLVEALFQELDPDRFRVAAFFDSGRILVSGGDRSGYFDVTTFLVEGTDHGFGPYSWRVQCLANAKGIVDWVGLPE